MPSFFSDKSNWVSSTIEKSPLKGMASFVWVFTKPIKWYSTEGLKKEIAKWVLNETKCLEK